MRTRCLAAPEKAALLTNTREKPVCTVCVGLLALLPLHELQRSTNLLIGKLEDIAAVSQDAQTAYFRWLETRLVGWWVQVWDVLIQMKNIQHRAQTQSSWKDDMCPPNTISEAWRWKGDALVIGEWAISMDTTPIWRDMLINPAARQWLQVFFLVVQELFGEESSCFSLLGQHNYQIWIPSGCERSWIKESRNTAQQQTFWKWCRRLGWKSHLNICRDSSVESRFMR